MMHKFDIIITGLGAAGLQLINRFIDDPFFENHSILLIDNKRKETDDRTWCYWENGKGEWDSILEASWNTIIFKSDIHSEETALANYSYKMIRSSKFYELIFSRIKTKDTITVVQEKVISILDENNSASVKTENNTYSGKKIFNSIVFDKKYINQNKYPSLKQHFVGWFVKTDTSVFDDTKVTFMDFNIPQKRNTRFMYILPINKNFALFEYTLFSKDELEKTEYEDGIKEYLDSKNISEYSIVEKEQGVIPMTSFKFWKKNSKNIVHIGTAGGWSKASTGFTFNNISKKTKSLTAFVKLDKPFTDFHQQNRFWWYDLLLLEVLSRENWRGSAIFSYLFKNNKVSNILRFLDEETSFVEDLRIMGSIPSYPFLKAIWYRLFK